MSDKITHTPMEIEYNGEVIDSNDIVDVNQGLDFNINELYINRFEPKDIVQVLNIDLLRVAQCLAPLGLDFPEFNQKVDFL